MNSYRLTLGLLIIIAVMMLVSPSKKKSTQAMFHIVRKITSEMTAMEKSVNREIRGLNGQGVIYTAQIQMVIRWC